MPFAAALSTVREPARRFTPSRTYARVFPSTCALGSITPIEIAPMLTTPAVASADMLELASTLTNPVTFTSGTLLVAAFSARSPMSASTTPVISAIEATAAPEMSPNWTGRESACTA